MDASKESNSSTIRSHLDTSYQTDLFALNDPTLDLAADLAVEAVAEKPTPQEKVVKSKQIKIAELELANVKVKVRTDATPSALKQIRELVDNRFEIFAEKSVKGMGPHQMMLLTAYSLAEELLKEREKTKVLKRRVNERLGRLLDRVESNLK